MKISRICLLCILQYCNLQYPPQFFFESDLSEKKLFYNIATTFSRHLEKMETLVKFA